MKKPLKFLNFVTLTFLTMALSETIAKQKNTGEINQVIGDLMYVKGQKFLTVSRLVVANTNPSINLQVIKVFKDIVVTRALEFDSNSLSPNDRVLNNTGQVTLRDKGSHT